MTARLLACPTCTRRVRAHEERCPFCRVALPPSFRDTPGCLPPPPGLTRDQLFRYALTASTVGAGALATAVALGSCGEPMATSYGFACCCMDGGNPSFCSGESEDAGPPANFVHDTGPPPNLVGDAGSKDAQSTDGGEAKTDATPDVLAPGDAQEGGGG
jgi:hypothetical protein